MRWDDARAFDAVGLALDALDGDTPDVLFIHIRMPDRSGLDLLRKVRETRPGLPAILTTAYSNFCNAVSAYEGSAFKDLPKLFDLHHARLPRPPHRQRQRKAGGRQILPTGSPELLGIDPAMQQVFGPLAA
ncbi:MAG: response regulator [Steroidobacteraceae bacterium]